MRTAERNTNQVEKPHRSRVSIERRAPVPYDLQCPVSHCSHIYQGFPTRMVYLYYTSCLRYTVLVGNLRYITVLKHLQCQSLEFVVETRILAEMKIENRRNFFFFRGGRGIDKHTFFAMKIKMMDL